jgi:hypothetical protein
MSAIDITRCLIVSPDHDPQTSAVQAVKRMLKDFGSKDITLWSGYSNSQSSVLDHQPTYVADFGFISPADAFHNLLRYEKPVMIDIFMSAHTLWHMYLPMSDGLFPMGDNWYPLKQLREAKVGFYRSGDNDSESNFIHFNEPRRVIRIPSRHYRGPCI